MFKYAFICAALMLMGSTAMADEGTISLSGQGSVSAEPDRGYITVGVVTVADNSAQAVKQNAKTMTDLYATLDKEGVTKPNIQTINYSISENWEETRELGRTARVRNGFRVTNMVRVTVCELDNFGKILDAVVGDGANSINGISFGSSKADELQDKARVLAVKDAVRRAGLITEALGVQLGDIASVSESSSRYLISDRYSMGASAESTVTPVSGGTLQFTASVNISWKLSKGRPLGIKLPYQKNGLPIPNIGVKPDNK